MNELILYAPVASIGIVVLSLIGVFATKLIKHKSVKKALVETVNVTHEYATLIMKEKVLRLREFAKNNIYSAESLFSTFNGKAGCFKMDSLLKDIQIECMRENVEYNKEYWVNYINEEVSKMKAVK